ncbi:MAG: septum formation initiator family protein [bacterium]|nr:septum formation initiator family protein [bacterium]
MLVSVAPHVNQRFRYSIAALFVGCVVLIFLGTAFSREAIKDYLLRKEIRRLESDLDRTRAEGQRLSELLGTVASPTWKEERARRELNLKRPGERVVVISEEQGRVEAARDVPAPEEGSNIGKWVDYFFEEE